MPRPQAVPEPEFSRTIEIDQIGPEGVSLEIVADRPEREALARRFALISVDRLAAALTVSPVTRKLFRIAGRLEAEVVQTCVVTLDPAPASVSETFSALFGEGGPGLSAMLSAEKEDGAPEPIEGGVIDLGETVAQHLSLSLDPYPRRPDARLPKEFADQAPAKAGENPFAALGSLKRPR